VAYNAVSAGYIVVSFSNYHAAKIRIDFGGYSSKKTLSPCQILQKESAFLSVLFTVV